MAQRPRWPIRYLLVAFAAILPFANAAEPTPDFAAEVRPLFEKYCFTCHGPDKQKGKLRIDALAPDFASSEAAGKWIECMDAINLSEMPPDDEPDLPMPTADERATMAGWVAAQVRLTRKRANSTHGRALMRRLTRTEYHNTVVDLLNVTFAPKQRPLDVLPPDGKLDGFNRVSHALLVDPSLLDTYFEVASTVADRAIQLGDPPVPTVRQRLEYEWYDDPANRTPGGSIDRSKSLVENGVVSMAKGFRTYGQLLHPYNNQLIPVPGRYAIRFRAGARRGADGKPVLFRVTRSGEGDLFYGEIDAPLDKPQVYEVIREMDVSGGGELNLAMVEPAKFGTTNRYYLNLSKQQETLAKGGDRTAAKRLHARKIAEGLYGQGRHDLASIDATDFPTVFIDYVEIEGPLYDAWPPASTKRIFFAGTDPATFDADYLRAIFDRLLPRAYRRPVTTAEVDQVVTIATNEWQATDSFVAGVKAGLITVLCSPHFLYLVEPAAAERRPLNHYEIAARLSYFLWSSMPDDALLAAAAAGELANPKAIERQTARMLASPKAEALVQGFARQWLRADEFSQFEPDRHSYKRFYQPEFNGIDDDLNKEPLAFFREIMRRNGDLRDFLDSDWTMVNKRLAAYYGLPVPAVDSDAFVRVKLPADSPRGGLLGMGAVHKRGSDGNRTKPVQRGVYVLETLFNDPPAPPPPNAGELEPNVKGENLTVRDRLRQHRQIESCRNCHQRLDPYGLALENFNVVGLWRDYQDGENRHWGRNDDTRINPAGKLPNGQEFTSFTEFKGLLRAQEDRFLRGFAEKLFTYALSRSVEPVDRNTIDGIVASLKTDPTLATAIREIVLSEHFAEK